MTHNRNGIAFAKLAMMAGIAALSTGLANAQNTPIGIPYQLTHSYNYDNSLSPDGKQMVFIKYFEGREQLFIMNADGRGEKQLTRADANHEDPAWSSDGTRIAFVKLENGSSIIHTINIDGTGEKAITPPDVKAIHPVWSADSRTLWYNNVSDLRPPEKNEAQIQTIDLATGAIESPVSDGVNTYPSLSPDGTMIAFRKIIDGNNSEVFIAKADGTNQKNLTNNPAFEGWPEWSPDGKRIAFAANRNSNYQIFLMNADGSNVQLAANTDGRATVPRWSRDGKTLYFTNCKNVDFRRSCEIMQMPVERDSQ